MASRRSFTKVRGIKVNEESRKIITTNVAYVSCALLMFSFSLAIAQEQDSSNSITKNKVFSRSIVLEVGASYTGFQNLSSQERIGFSLGITRKFNLAKDWGLSFSGYLSQQNMFLKRVPGFGGNSEQVTRKYFDHDISVLFIEVPVFFSYQLWQRGNKSLHIALGMGVSVSVRNDSKQMNFVLTDEVLDVPPSVEARYLENSVFENSGSNINTSIWLNYRNYLFKIVYLNKFIYFNDDNALMGYSKAHTLLFNLGYYIN
jgi:hypothetical protein